MNADTLVMESTTDTPEQMREGLGLPALDAETHTPDASTDEDGDVGLEEAPPAEAAEVDPEPVVETPVAPVVPKAAAPVAPVKPKPAAKPTQKELDRVAARARREAETKAEILAAENKTLRELLDRGVAPAVQLTGEIAPDPTIAADYAAKRAKLGAKPKQTDFEDFDEFEDKRDTWIENRATLNAQEALAHQGAAQRSGLDRERATRDVQAQVTVYEASALAARARHADFAQVMQAADNRKAVLGDHLKAPILRCGDAGGEIAYHLAKHPDVLASLNAMDAVDAALEIGALRRTLMSPTPAARPPVKPVSRAPAPQGTELGAASSVIADDLENATSQAEYNRMRDKQDKARRRR